MQKIIFFIKKYAVLFFSIILIMYGQKLFFSTHYITGIYSTVAGFLILILWYAFSQNVLLKINFSYILTFFSVLTGIFAILLVKKSPGIGLLLFILAGIFLLISKPREQKLLEFVNLPENTKPVQLWEIISVIFLVIFVFAVRFWNFDSVPPGAQGHEGTVVSSYDLLKSRYISFIGDGLDWPTLIYYQGMFFADLFGKYITSYRIPISIWGGLAVIAFYFVARRITSPFTALIFSLVFSVQEVFLIFSRILGTHIVCFIPHILAFGLLLQAIKNNKWWMFLAAGMSAGFGLHAYWPGRTVPFIFLFWFIWLFLFYRKEMPSIKNQLIFWLGFLIISGPVVYVAITNPDLYWGYIKGINPNQSKGIAGYLKIIKDRLPIYMQMFHIKSDLYWGFKTAYVPIFDYVLQYFFPIGFFMCLFTFWTPLSSFLIAAFCAGMLVGILGGDNLGHPTTNRIIMAYPVASLFAAIAFERMRIVLNQNSNKIISLLIILIGLLLAGWSVKNGVNNYFNIYMQNPAVITTQRPDLYFAGLEAKKNKDKRHIITNYLIEEEARDIRYFSGRDYMAPYFYNGLLILDENIDYIFTLQGHLESFADYMQKLFPDAKIKKYINDKLDHPYYKNFVSQQQPFLDWTDPFNKNLYLISVIVPKDNIKKFHDLINTETGDKGEVFNDDFGKKNAGKFISLSGAIILDSNYKRIDEPEKVNTFNVRINLPWKNWEVFINGKKEDINKNINLIRGIHFITLKGNVPKNFSGKLPLEIFAQGSNFDESGRLINEEDLIKGNKLVAISKPIGMKFYYIPENNNWDAKPLYVQQEFLSTKYIGYIKMNCPFSLKAEGYLEVPETGQYELSMSPYIYGRIFINNNLIFSNFSDLKKPEINKVIFLAKNRKYFLRVNYQFYCADPRMKVFCVYIKGPQDTKEKILPIDWVSPY